MKLHRLLLLALPLALALALAAAFLGRELAPTTEADSTTTPEMHLLAAGTGVTCNTGPTACTVPSAGSFTLTVQGNDGAATNVAVGFATLVYLDGLTATPATSQISYTPCGLPIAALNPSGAIGHGCAQFVGSGVWTNEPTIVAFPVTCNADGAHTVVLTAVLPAPPSPTAGSKFKTAGSDLLLKSTQGPQKINDPVAGSITVNVADILTINCGAVAAPTATRTNTTVPAGPTATPTATRTPTITNTPGGPTNTPAPPTSTYTPAPPTATRTPTVVVPPTRTRTPTAKLLGDVDGDRDVDSIDALWVLWVDARLADRSDLTNADSADVNHDGMIDSIDALYILWIQANLYSPM